MELRDARRFAGSMFVLALVTIGWWTALFFQNRGDITWDVVAAGQGELSMQVWTWILGGALFLWIALLAVVVLGLDALPSGWHKGSVRQVQCTDCKAVFFINDTGHRPLTHRCPNCRRMGIYDGRAEPAGDAHKRVTSRDVVQLALRCKSCEKRFDVTDSGHRPLLIDCPACGTKGKLR